MFMYLVAMIGGSFMYEPEFAICVVAGIIIAALALMFLLDRLVGRE